MNISHGQWLLAILAAASAHLCLLGFFLLGDGSHQPPDETPRGIMVSLDAFDPGPPPKNVAENTPIEAAQPNIAVPSAPAPAATAGPAESGTAAAVATPEAAADIGPQPAESALSSTADAPRPGSPDVTPASERAPAAPQVTSAVTIRPDNVSEAIAPQEQVTARAVNPGDLSSSSTARQPNNGAYGTSDEATDDYIVRLRGWLSRHKRYPAAARADDIQGTVRLYLVIDANGNLLSQRVVESSGSALLDEAAKQMLTRSEPLPRMSASMRRNRLELVVPVVFSLH